MLSNLNERKCPVSATFGLISTSAFYYNVFDVQRNWKKDQQVRRRLASWRN